MGIPSDFDDFCVVRKAIDHCRHAWCSWKDLIPFFEGEIGADADRGFFVTAVHDFKDEISSPAIKGKVSDLIDYQKIPRFIVS
jgi:hypothetical protein